MKQALMKTILDHHKASNNISMKDMNIISISAGLLAFNILFF